MNTKAVMSGSAVFLMAAGIACSFMPFEIASFFIQSQSTPLLSLFIQLTGALYFAFGMINWMARANLIGGIYARPTAIGNFTHFAIGSLAALKAYLNNLHGAILVIAGVYVILGLLFGIILFTHPVKEQAQTVDAKK